MKTRYLFLLLFVPAALSGCFNGYNANGPKDKEPAVCGVVDTNDNPPPNIFKRKCATCHYLTKDATGPKLAGSLKRAPSEAWLRQYITDENSLIEAGDTAAIQRMELKPTKAMHQHTIPETELDELINYIR